MQILARMIAVLRNVSMTPIKYKLKESLLQNAKSKQIYFDFEAKKEKQAAISGTM